LSQGTNAEGISCFLLKNMNTGNLLSFMLSLNVHFLMWAQILFSC